MGLNDFVDAFKGINASIFDHLGQIVGGKAVAFLVGGCVGLIDLYERRALCLIVLSSDAMSDGVTFAVSSFSNVTLICSNSLFGTGAINSIQQT